MYLKHTIELTLTLNTETFQKVMDRAYDKSTGFHPTDGDKYVDRTFFDKGLIVTYHEKQYKSKVRLTVNPNVILDGDAPDEDNIPKLIRTLEKCVDGYFGGKYQLNDFKLSKMFLITDIDVHSRDKAAAYIKVLQRVGKVKGFSLPRDNWLDDDISFCLNGNSNGIEFMVYDLEGLLRHQADESDSDDKQLKTITKKAAGLIRSEVRLVEPKAIRDNTHEYDTAAQIADISVKGEKIFLNTFMRAVPFGDFYKKDKAVEIINKKVSDKALKRRMLRLVELIPEKRSLLLAQKAMNCRKVDEVMNMFGAIDVSPVTLSKRSEDKMLDNLYKYI